MTLSQCVAALKHISLAQKNVRSFGEGDIYSFMNADPALKYSVVYLTQNQHQTDTESDFTRYSFNIFYIDRLTSTDGENTLQIQSIGKEVITNIIRLFCKEYDAEVYGTIFWQSFTQRFADECSGIYATLTLEVPEASVCPE